MMYKISAWLWFRQSVIISQAGIQNYCKYDRRIKRSFALINGDIFHRDCKIVPGVGFEPTRTIRPLDLKSNALTTRPSWSWLILNSTLKILILKNIISENECHQKVKNKIMKKEEFYYSHTTNFCPVLSKMRLYLWNYSVITHLQQPIHVITISKIA